MVLLNYNFVSTHVDTLDNTRCLTCKMPMFVVKIKVSTRNFHKTWHFHNTSLWIYTHKKSYCLHGYIDQLSCFV